ncbi:Rieske (2Fe-2S) protein [Pontibacter sp. JAM-7]|uniref:Rieske (2Fe-2S) protein n=1 Tax=Pontibacter sp. JAM-7 TaxID=3366581 RepID=UPI003AF5180A
MQPLCQLNDIPEDEARGFSCQGISLLAVKYRGGLYVYHNSCPHRSIPLEWQPDQFFDYEKTFLQCATHGALFKIDSGECISGPCVGDSLTAVTHAVTKGTIMVDLSQLLPAKADN